MKFTNGSYSFNPLISETSLEEAIKALKSVEYTAEVHKALQELQSLLYSIRQQKSIDALFRRDMGD